MNPSSPWPSLPRLLGLLPLLGLLCVGCTQTPAPPPTPQPPPPPVSNPPPPTPKPPTGPDPALVQARQSAAALASTGLHKARLGALAQTRTVPPAPGKILLIGDSMAWPLGKAIGPLAQNDGHTFQALHQVNDSLFAWRKDGLKRLKQALRQSQPDAVILVLGTNDFLDPAPENHAGTLKRINDLIAPRACYWVGPPKLYRADAGMVQYLTDHATPCAYFDSEKIKITRHGRGWHPDVSGSQDWGKAVWDWIRLNPPAPASSATAVRSTP